MNRNLEERQGEMRSRNTAKSSVRESKRTLHSLRAHLRYARADRNRPLAARIEKAIAKLKQVELERMLKDVEEL
jgi:hypothetical protein